MATSGTGGDSVRTDVAWACRILANEGGYQDLTLGHVSARDPENPDCMWIKRRGVTLAEVSADDVIRFGIGADLKGSGEMHLEAVLHTAVYERRPDVGAIVHGHPPYATAFAGTDAELMHLTHDAVMFKDGLARYDGGPDLITEPAQGADVAAALGDHSVVLLRNHGVLIAERDLPWVVLAAVTLERAVMMQSIVGTLGSARPIPESEIEDLHRSKYNGTLVSEYWQAWIRDMRRRGLDAGIEAR